MLETEQPTVKSNRADSFIRANILGKEAIVHLEMQTHDSREVGCRIVWQVMLAEIESFQLPIYSHVINLHPRAGQTDPGEYIQEMLNYEIRIRYKVIRLYDLEEFAVSGGGCIQRPDTFCAIDEATDRHER